jgi:hypothetical protein
MQVRTSETPTMECYAETINHLVGRTSEMTESAKGSPKTKSGYNHIDIREIRDQLSRNEISWQDVMSLFESMPYRPWATKSWRKMRDARIDMKCATCGTIEGPMVLQHTRQPPKPSSVLKRYERLNRDALREWLESHPPRLDLSACEKTADACPKCGSQVLRYRKSTNDWICVGVERGVACGNHFKASVKQVSKWIVRDLEKAHQEQEKMRFFDQAGIGLQAARDMLGFMIRYLTMKDTKTLCKRCAFIEDRVTRRTTNHLS